MEVSDSSWFKDSIDMPELTLKWSTAFLSKLGKAPSSQDPAALAKTLRDPAVIDATFAELSKYHVGKLNG